MRRSIFYLFAALVVAIGSASAQAGWHEFWDGVHRDYHRNNAWPYPFVNQDAAAVMAPQAIMIHNGWRAQSLMSDHHFKPETNELTSAGRAKVRWMLTQAPTQYRTIFVQRTDDRETTLARVDSVQRAAQLLLPDGELPAVEQTDITPRGWSADEINATHVKFRDTFPAPRLPEVKSTTSGE